MRWEDYGVVRRHSRRTDDGICGYFVILMDIAVLATGGS